MKDNNKYNIQVNLALLQNGSRNIVGHAFYSTILFLLFVANNSLCQEKIIQLKASREIKKSYYPRVEIIPNFLTLNDENQLLYKKGIIYLTSQTEVLKIDIKRKFIKNRIYFQKPQFINNSTIDNSGNLWFISKDSLFIVDPFLRKIEFDSKKVNPISIMCNKTGEIYLLAKYNSLAKVLLFDRGNWIEKYDVPADLKIDSHVRLTVNHKEELVISGANFFYVLRDQEKWSIRYIPNSNTNRVKFDSDGNMLFNLESLGDYNLYYQKNKEEFNPKKMFIYKSENVTFNKENDIIVKGRNHLLKVNKSTLKHDTLTLPKNVNRISGLETSEDGSIWTYSNLGILQIAKEGITIYQLPFRTSDLFYSVNQSALIGNNPPLMLNKKSYKSFQLTNENIKKINKNNIKNITEVALDRYNYIYKTLKMKNTIYTISFSPYNTRQHKQPKLQIKKIINGNSVEILFPFQIDPTLTSKEIKVLGNKSKFIWIKLRNSIYRLNISKNQWEHILQNDKIIDMELLKNKLLILSDGNLTLIRSTLSKKVINSQPEINNFNMLKVSSTNDIFLFFEDNIAIYKQPYKKSLISFKFEKRRELNNVVCVGKQGFYYNSGGRLGYIDIINKTNMYFKNDDNGIISTPILNISEINKRTLLVYYNWGIVALHYPYPNIFNKQNSYYLNLSEIELNGILKPQIYSKPTKIDGAIIPKN